MCNFVLVENGNKNVKEQRYYCTQQFICIYTAIADFHVDRNANENLHMQARMHMQIHYAHNCQCIHD